jgi:hypothetical protein
MPDPIYGDERHGFIHLSPSREKVRVKVDELRTNNDSELPKIPPKGLSDNVILRRQPKNL